MKHVAPTSPASKDRASKHSGGRPTKAAAAERDERLLEIAARMFMEHGFDATSMDGLAEAAAVGKATVYARYADKAALFAAVLHRRILQVYLPLEEEFADLDEAGTALGEVLRLVARRLLDQLLSPDAVAVSRILAAQSARFPELGRLAVQEGTFRQTKLVETILARFAGGSSYRVDDLELAADLFLSMALGRAARIKLFGVPVDVEQAKRRVDAAVDMFLNGFLRHG